MTLRAVYGVYLLQSREDLDAYRERGWDNGSG